MSPLDVDITFDRKCWEGATGAHTSRLIEPMRRNDRLESIHCRSSLLLIPFRKPHTVQHDLHANGNNPAWLQTDLFKLFLRLAIASNETLANENRRERHIPVWSGIALSYRIRHSSDGTTDN